MENVPSALVLAESSEVFGHYVVDNRPLVLHIVDQDVMHHIRRKLRKEEGLEVTQ